MPIYLASNTHRRARIWSSDRNCRTIFVVYATASPRKALDLGAKATINQRFRRTRRGHGDVTPSSLPLGPGSPVMFAGDRFRIATMDSAVGSGERRCVLRPPGDPGANSWRALKWPVLPLCLFSLPNPALLAISRKSG